MSAAAYSISLTVIAFLAGLAILPVFARFSDKAKLSLAKRKIRAALYALRLFGDEPRLVFRAQGQLLLWNARYLGLMLRPAAIVLLPMLILLFQMDVVYGHRALHIGESTIVTARMADAVNLSATTPVLKSDGMAVETPAVRLPDEHRVLWRVRALRSGRNSLTISVPGSDGALASAQKNVQAGSGLHYLAEKRGTSLLNWLRYPAQPSLPANGPVRSISIQYPDANADIFGIGMPWIVWFVIVSWTTMFALRKHFGVII